MGACERLQKLIKTPFILILSPLSPTHHRPSSSLITPTMHTTIQFCPPPIPIYATQEKKKKQSMQSNMSFLSFFSPRTIKTKANDALTQKIQIATSPPQRAARKSTNSNDDETQIKCCLSILPTSHSLLSFGCSISFCFSLSKN